VKRKNRVLAIDDEPAMTDWLKVLLEHAGYEVKTAFIGARGEELCDRTASQSCCAIACKRSPRMECTCERQTRKCAAKLPAGRHEINFPVVFPRAAEC